MSAGVSAGAWVGSAPSGLSSLNSDMLKACSKRPEARAKVAGPKQAVLFFLEGARDVTRNRQMINASCSAHGNRKFALS